MITASRQQAWAWATSRRSACSSVFSWSDETNDRILQLRTELANATTESSVRICRARIDLTNNFLPAAACSDAGQLELQMDQAKTINPINGWTAAVRTLASGHERGQADAIDFLDGVRLRLRRT
jgi:hypothetical protein